MKEKFSGMSLEDPYLKEDGVGQYGSGVEAEGEVVEREGFAKSEGFVPDKEQAQERLGRELNRAQAQKIGMRVGKFLFRKGIAA